MARARRGPYGTAVVPLLLLALLFSGASGAPAALSGAARGPKAACFAAAVPAPPAPAAPVGRRPPDVRLLPGARVGGRSVEWGGSVCLRDDDVPFAEGEVEESLQVLGRGFSLEYALRNDGGDAEVREGSLWRDEVLFDNAPNLAVAHVDVRNLG